MTQGNKKYESKFVKYWGDRMENSDTMFLCLSCGEKSEHEDTGRSEKRDRNSSWSLRAIPRMLNGLFRENTVCPSCGATALVHLNKAAAQYSLSPDELSYVFRPRKKNQ